jgi:amino acid transporter
LNALCVSLVIVSLLALINIGSPIAFNAIVSLGVSALLTSYIISTSCVRLKRWRGLPLPPARWSMGKWSSSVETFAILFLIIAWIFAFFPITREVTPQTMNWSCAIFGGVVIFSLIYYYLVANKVYQGPVTRIRPWAEMVNVH